MDARLVLVLIAAGALFAVATLSFVGWPASDYRDGDFFQFRAGARALLEGVSPYDAEWWRSFHEREGSRALQILLPFYGTAFWTTPYPVWTFLVLLPFGILPLPVAAASWLVLQLLGVGAGLAVLARAVGLMRDRTALLFIAALAALFQPTMFLVIGGNVTGFVFTAFAFSVAALLEGRSRAAGALFALVLIKPQSFVVTAVSVLAAIAPDRRRRFLIGAALVSSFLLTATLLLSPSWPAAWLTAATTLQASNGSNATGWTLGRVVGGPALSAASVVLLASSFAAWWRLRKPEPALLVAAAIPVSIFVAPHGWSHEHLYLLVSAVILLARIRSLRGRAGITPVVALLVVFGLLPWILVAIPRVGEAPSALVPACCFAFAVWVDLRTRALGLPARRLAIDPGGASA